MRKICSMLLVPTLLVFCGEKMQLSSSLDAEISGESITETFKIDSTKVDRLDILLVIDGSESMAEQRATIARKLKALLEHIKERNWRIGITSTDMTDCYAAVIDAQTPNYEEVYRAAIDGIKRSNAEQTIFMVRRGLSGMPVRTTNNECDDNKIEYLVLDDNSAIGILIVTDEDHQCDSTLDINCEIQDLYDHLQMISIPHVTAKVYGFLHPNKSDKFLAWRDEGGESIFTRYEPYDTGNYDAVLKSISSDLSTSVQYKYKLRYKHDDEAAKVKVIFDDGSTKKLSTNEFGIKGKKLLMLTTLPPNAATIEVTYSYQP